MNVWVIAFNTYREGIRKKVLIAFVLFAFLSLGSSTLLTTLSPGEEVKMIKDVCLSSISFFGMLIAVFVTSYMLPSEVSTRTIYTVLSKPIRRASYIWGKFIGAQMIILLNLALMTILFLIILYFREGKISLMLLQSVVLTYFELMLLSSLTLALSTFSTSSALPALGGVFIYIMGHITQYLKDMSFHVQSDLMSSIIKSFYLILPNLSNFNLRNQLIHLPPDEIALGSRFYVICIYGIIYGTLGMLLAQILFRKKEV